MKKISQTLMLGMLLFAVLLTQAIPAYADTPEENGVLVPEQLTIQLGKEWAGVEFQLKTDAGLYPGTIAVNDQGVLELEIGGSSFYALSCMLSAIPAPGPDQIIPSEQPLDTGVTEPKQTQDDKTPAPEEVEKTRIPTLQLVLFIGGLVAGIGGLIVMYVSKKRRSFVYNDEEDDE